MIRPIERFYKFNISHIIGEEEETRKKRQSHVTYYFLN